MVQYRRNFVPGGIYFFTVTLADRTSSALLDHVDALRMAFRITRHERPFTIDAIVIMPEHLHAIWTLPSGDSDFSGRWKRIKAYFTHRFVAAGVPVKRQLRQPRQPIDPRQFTISLQRRDELLRHFETETAWGRNKAQIGRGACFAREPRSKSSITRFRASKRSPDEQASPG